MRPKKSPNIYKQAERFAEITKTLFLTGNSRRAKKCLQIADQLLSTGTYEIKNAISNVYLFYVSSFMEIHHYGTSNLLPQNLKLEFNKQVNASGI